MAKNRSEVKVELELVDKFSAGTKRVEEASKKAMQAVIGLGELKGLDEKAAGAKLKGAADQIKKYVNEVEAEVKAHEANLARAGDKLDELMIDRGRIDKALPNLTKARNKIASEVEKLEAEQTAKQKAANDKRNADLETAYKRAQTIVKQQETRLRNARGKVEARITSDNSEVERLEAEIKTLKGKGNIKRNSTDPADIERAARIKEASEAVKVYRKQIADARKELSQISSAPLEQARKRQTVAKTAIDQAARKPISIEIDLDLENKRSKLLELEKQLKSFNAESERNAKAIAAAERDAAIARERIRSYSEAGVGAYKAADDIDATAQQYKDYVEQRKAADIEAAESAKRAEEEVARKRAEVQNILATEAKKETESVKAAAKAKLDAENEAAAAAAAAAKAELEAQREIERAAKKAAEAKLSSYNVKLDKDAVEKLSGQNKPIKDAVNAANAAVASIGNLDGLSEAEVSAKLKAVADEVSKFSRQVESEVAGLEGALKRSMSKMSDLGIERAKIGKTIANIRTDRKTAMDAMQKVESELRAAQKSGDDKRSSELAIKVKDARQKVAEIEAMLAKGVEDYASNRASIRSVASGARIQRDRLDSARGAASGMAAPVAAIDQQLKAHKANKEAAEADKKLWADRAAAIKKLSAEVAASQAKEATATEKANREARRAADAKRRAADAAREAKNESKAWATAVSMIRYQVIGMISSYMGLNTAVDQFSKSVDAFRNLEAFGARMNYLFDGASDLAQQELDYIRGVADELGFEITSLQDQYAKFAIAASESGVSLANTRVIFEGVTAAARTNKLSTDEMGRAFTSLTQMMGKNQVMAEELKGQLAEALPGSVGLFAKSMGYAENQMGQFYKALENGDFRADAVVKFGEYLKGNFADSAKAASMSFEAMMNRFKNSMTYAREAVAKNGLIDGLADFMGRMQEMFESDEGRKFFIQLGTTAKGVLNIMAYLVENIDTIGKLLAGIAIFKVFKFLGSTLSGPARVLGAIVKNAHSLTNVMRILRVAVGGLAGPFGLLATAASFALPWLLDFFNLGGKAQAIIEMEDKLKSVSDTIGEVGAAAMDAKGDVDDFLQRLNSIGPQKIQLAIETSNDIEETLKKDIQEALRFPRYALGGYANSDKLLNDSLKSYLDGNMTLQRDKQEDPEGILDVLEDLRKTGFIPDENINNLRSAINRIEEVRINTKKLTTAMDALNGSLEAQNELMTESAELEAKRVARLTEQADEAMKSLVDMIDDGTGRNKISEDFKKVGDAAKKATESLDALKDSIDPSEYARRSRDIGRAFETLAQKARTEFMNAEAAANGFSVTFGNMSTQAAMANGASIPSQYGGQSRMFSADSNVNADLLNDPNTRTFLDYIAKVESSSGADAYNITLDHGKWVKGFNGNTSGQVDLTKMTLNEVRELQRYMLGHEENRLKYKDSRGRPTGSSAVGRYQIVGKTLQGLMDELGLTGNELYDENMQDALALTLANRRRGNPEGFMNEWQAFRHLNLGNEANALHQNIPNMPIFVPREVAQQRASAQAAPAEDLNRNLSAAQAIQAMASSITPEALDAVTTAALNNPALGEDPRFLTALRDKEYEAVAAVLDGVDAALAEKFRKGVQGAIAARDTERNVENYDMSLENDKTVASNVRDAYTAGLNASLDLADRRRAHEINTRASTREQLGKNAPESEIERLVKSEMDRFDAQHAAEIQKFLNEAGRSQADAVAMAQAANDVRREEIRLANEARDRHLEGAQAEAYIRDGLETYRLAQAAEINRAHDEEIRSLQDQAQITSNMAAMDRVRLETLQAIGAEERRTGIALTEAQKAARVSAAQAAYRTQNPEYAIDDANRLFDTSELEARADLIRSQMEAAKSAGDTTKLEELKAELAAVNEELRKMIDLKIAALSAAGGEGTEREIANLRRQTQEMRNANETVSNYGQAAVYWSNRAGDAMANSMLAAAKAFVDGENAFKSFGQAIAQTVGQILIDIGTMIIKAVIAKKVMEMLGVDNQGNMTGKGVGGIFGSIMTGAFNAITGASAGAVPQMHTGGIVGQPGLVMNDLSNGLKSDERLTVLQDGEEVLTRNDPRHRFNIGKAAATLKSQYYHSGGIVGAAGASAPAPILPSIMEAMPKGAGGGEPKIEINNMFDESDLVNRFMASDAGAKAVMNVITKNPRKFKNLLGVS